MTTSNLLKIHVTLPADSVFGGESMWAKPLGGNKYRVENIPFFAFDLNAGDVIICDEEREFKRVSKRSGNCTFRILLKDGTTEEQARDMIASLKEWGAEGAEGGFGVLIAANVPSEHFVAVDNRLQALEAEGKISGYEHGSVPA